MHVKLAGDIELNIATLPVNRFCELFGLSKGQIQGKVYARNPGQDPIWTEGVEYIRDPDNKLHIILEGYEQWVLKNCQQVSKSAANESEFGSVGKVKGFTKPSEKHTQPLLSAQRSYELK